jgi:hypothetical protein
MSLRLSLSSFGRFKDLFRCFFSSNLAFYLAYLAISRD